MRVPTAADLLNRRAIDRAYEKAIIVASVKTLGEMRKHYHSEFEKRLAGEIAKDPTGRSIDRIEKIIAGSGSARRPPITLRRGISIDLVHPSYVYHQVQLPRSR